MLAQEADDEREDRADVWWHSSPKRVEVDLDGFELSPADAC